MIQQIEKINPRLVLSKVKPKIIDQTNEDRYSESKKVRLEQFHDAWNALSPWRRERMKWARYYNGDQLLELVTDDNGRTVTEAEYISGQGKVPLKQNIIKPVCTSIVGQFRADRGKPVITAIGKGKEKQSGMLSQALQSALDYNDTKELDAAALTEKLVSGLPIQRITHGYWPEDRRYDVLVENINPNFVFFNPDVDDVRWRNLTLIGRIIDISYGGLLTAFGSSPQKIDVLKEVYGRNDRYKYISTFNTFDPNKHYSLDFYVPHDLSLCRVIEAWELKTIEVLEIHDWMDGTLKEFDGTLDDVAKLNEYRKQKYMAAGFPETEVPVMEAKKIIKQRWFYGFYSPWGDVLDEGETPYWHGSHPFVLAPNISVDKKMTGLVHDLYDQQRQINRLFTLQDFILGTSAKNTLIVDEASLNGQNIDDIADDYRRVGGVIVLKLKDGAKPPFEIGKNVANLGINEMIQYQLKLVQDISGVHPSMQGQRATSGTPASAIAQEAQNSSMNLKPILESFNTFRKDRNEKVLKTIQQFYNDKRWLSVAGQGYSSDMMQYDPEMVKDVEFSLVIAQGSDSPVYRGIIDEQLKEFLMGGLIDFPTYLQNTSLPFAETLLESIKQQSPQQQQQAMQGLQADPSLQADPNALRLMEKAVAGR